jgi:F-type H+-transporting ATPase subunit epsilon
MAGTLLLEVATPERLLVREDATEVYIPGSDGMLGILPDHAPMLGALGTGELSIVTATGRRSMFVSGGWLQVLNNEVRVLADRAEHIEEIDVVRAEKALKRAQERLAAPASAGIDVARAINAMKRAEARLALGRAASKLRPID